MSTVITAKKKKKRTISVSPDIKGGTVGRLKITKTVILLMAICTLAVSEYDFAFLLYQGGWVYCWDVLLRKCSQLFLQNCIVTLLKNSSVYSRLCLGLTTNV